MFAEGMEVKYRNMCGIVNFICDQYIVIQLPAKPSRNPARILVFRECYKEVTVFKDSDK